MQGFSRTCAFNKIWIGHRKNSLKTVKISTFRFSYQILGLKRVADHLEKRTCDIDNTFLGDTVNFHAANVAKLSTGEDFESNA